MRILTRENLMDILYGCTILGTGGGGSLDEGIAMINEAAPGEGFITLKSLEAFEKAADGQSTKIIIPSELQSVAGLATGISEVLKK